MSTLRSGTYGNYYGSLYNESEPLPMSQMQVNAKYIYSALTAAGWTPNAIAAMLGNNQAESTINPGRWQSDDVGWSSGGYGIVQWTPTTKYINWCTEQGFSDPSEMDNNLARVLWEVANGEQWVRHDSHYLTFSEFTKSTAAPSWLGVAFLLNYEMPADQSESVQQYRAGLADYWYEYITGITPTPPTPPSPGGTSSKRKKFNFILFGKHRRNFV